jgi:putative glutamine amidotransferase
VPYNASMRVLVSLCDHRPSDAQKFRAAWLRAGGEAAELVFVTPSTAAGLRPASAAFDGLLLAGGPDVEPWRVGADPEAGVELRLDRARDALDSELLERAARHGSPVLGICYGCQILAASAGGTVVQDLVRAGRSGHSVPGPDDRVVHEVVVSPNARFLPAADRRVAVNSRHHQAVAEPGEGLSVVARADDGVVEAIEAEKGDRFVLGVQWHPEDMSQQDQVAIFRAFRSACLAGVSDRGRRTTVPGRR